MLTYKFPNNLPWFLVFLCFQIIVPIVTFMEIYVSHIHPCTHILFHASLKPNLSKTCFEGSYSCIWRCVLPDCYCGTEVWCIQCVCFQSVPHGVLCFLPSYRALEKFTDRWKVLFIDLICCWTYHLQPLTYCLNYLK